MEEESTAATGMELLDNKVLSVHQLANATVTGQSNELKAHQNESIKLGQRA